MAQLRRFFFRIFRVNSRISPAPNPAKFRRGISSQYVLGGNEIASCVAIPMPRTGYMWGKTRKWFSTSNITEDIGGRSHYSQEYSDSKTPSWTEGVIYENIEEHNVRVRRRNAICEELEKVVLHEGKSLRHGRKDIVVKKLFQEYLIL